MAVTERREITFDVVALTDIFTTSGIAGTIGLPSMPPGRIELDTHGQIVILHYEIAKKTRTIPLKLETIGALLISFCVRSHIPLPRKASKTIRVANAGVILLFQSSMAALHPV